MGSECWDTTHMALCITYLDLNLASKKAHGSTKASSSPIETSGYGSRAHPWLLTNFNSLLGCEQPINLGLLPTALGLVREPKAVSHGLGPSHGQVGICIGRRWGEMLRL